MLVKERIGQWGQVVRLRSRVFLSLVQVLPRSQSKKLWWKAALREATVSSEETTGHGPSTAMAADLSLQHSYLRGTSWPPHLGGPFLTPPLPFRHHDPPIHRPAVPDALSSLHCCTHFIARRGSAHISISPVRMRIREAGCVSDGSLFCLYLVACLARH